VKVLSDADFASKILHSSKSAAVLFSSPTCPICQTLKKTYAEAAQNVKEQAEFYDMDVTITQTWRTYNVAVTPTILIFTDGQLKKTFTGLPSKSEIVAALKKTA
jgi:thioredoxin-like negative regulator of GroEL